ncbi:MAG: recombinase family protein [Oscillospiraceae bacterium]|nr:recombinase family protein [Oscillospiraceae bacterium]
MSKAVIYARYSCDNQREDSIEGQLRECKAFAERKGYTVVNVYADRAVSAKTDNRPEFQKMVKDSAKKEFDIIIVWKLDRFSRNRADSLKYKSILMKNNVSVVSATETISEGAEGIILESVLEGMAEYYSVDLSEKVVRGMKENVLNGKSNGGPLTFGYMVNKDKYFEKNPDTAPLVTDIFNRYADGETIISIIDDLNGKGLTNKGKKFTYHFVNGLLTNRRYLGEYSFLDVVNPNAFPPLVSEEVFKICRQRLDANKHKCGSFKKVEEKFLLTGKIFCGYCGSTVAGTGGTGRSKVYHYYQCKSANRKRCSKKAVAKKLIEEAVIEVIHDVLDNKSLIKRISSACFALQKNESSQLPALRKQLKQNKKEISNIMKAVKAGIVTKSTKAELERLEQEQEVIEAEIVKEKIDNAVVPAEHIEDWILSFAKIKLNTPEQKMKLIDFFVNSIFLYDDKLVVMLNYKGGEKTICFEALNEGIKKENTQKSECSSLFEYGDPYGN